MGNDAAVEDSRRQPETFLLRVREAVPSDCQQLLEIRHSAFRRILEGVRPWVDDAEREAMQHRIANDRVRLYSVQGRVVAYASTESRTTEIWLHNLMVEPEYQSQGLGGQILRSLQSEARAAGNSLWLKVLEHNQRAIGFYTRHRFREEPPRPPHRVFSWDPESDEPEL